MFKLSILVLISAFFDEKERKPLIFSMCLFLFGLFIFFALNSWMERE